MPGIVYQAKHIPSGRVYVGCTTNPLEVRRAQHVESAHYSKGSKTKFYAALDGHFGDFEWTVLETLESDDRTLLFAAEAKWINNLNSEETGFNSTICPPKQRPVDVLRAIQMGMPFNDRYLRVKDATMDDFYGNSRATSDEVLQRLKTATRSEKLEWLKRKWVNDIQFEVQLSEEFLPFKYVRNWSFFAQRPSEFLYKFSNHRQEVIRLQADKTAKASLRYGQIDKRHPLHGKKVFFVNRILRPDLTDEDEALAAQLFFSWIEGEQSAT